ncbi:hypothetical protein [Paenibacillus sp. MSJ-34]|uniref:hypothetical protein n=1 Tax=Paenibacillus sp. MSJ-34 TaxID=2841529 RepID=UPI001C0F8A62|nr:hypothetical protein [Paenibacillus sp. MSJ-34]MBU5443620.1 hypothetical protein [Paenibacillus sp. MSJ-34]
MSVTDIAADWTNELPPFAAKRTSSPACVAALHEALVPDYRSVLPRHGSNSSAPAQNQYGRYRAPERFTIKIPY